MLNVSDEYREAIRHPHRRMVRVTTDPGGDEIPISGGSITHGLDGSDRAINVRSATIELPLIQNLIPDSESHPLSPFGNSLRVEIGVETAAGWEWGDHGLFYIMTTSVRRPSGAITVECGDLIAKIGQVELQGLERANNNDPAVDQVRRWASWALGLTQAQVPIGRNDAGNQSPDGMEDREFNCGDSRLALIRKIVEYTGPNGHTVSFNAQGELELIDLSPPYTAVDRLSTGKGGVIVDMQSSITNIEVPNRYQVRMTDQNDNSVLGEATTTTGPLRWDGPYGRHRMGEQMGGLLGVTQAGADKLAAKRLKEKQLRARQVNLTCSPLPHLEATDAVELEFPSGHTEMGFVHTITTGLSVDSGSSVVFEWDPDVAGVGPLSANQFLGGER